MPRDTNPPSPTLSEEERVERYWLDGLSLDDARKRVREENFVLGDSI